jgi:hypothetical protein
MIKKIMLLLMTSILMNFTLFQTLHATDNEWEISITGDLTWSIGVNGTGRYYIESNRFLLDSHKLSMMLSKHIEDFPNVFVHSTGTTYTNWSRVEFYDTDVSSNLLGYRSIMNAIDAPDYLTLGISSFSQLEQYKNKYAKIIIMFNTSYAQPITSNMTRNILNDFAYYGYDFTIQMAYEVTSVPITSLPITSGNPYQLGETGIGFGWDYLDNTFYISITYGKVYNLQITNVAFADPSFLERVNSVDYYTVDGERYLQFNFKDNPNALLQAPEGSNYTGNWNGFAVWNLSTNEFIMYNRAIALTYIEVIDRNVYGYLYLPSIEMDNMLSVAGSFNYQYGYRDFWQTQRYKDPEIAFFNLEKDRQSDGRLGGIEGALPQWTFDLMQYSLVAVGVGTILSLIPGTQPVGVPLLVAGLAGMMTSGAYTVYHVLNSGIDELVPITPTGDLRTRLNTHYTAAAGTTVTLPTQAKVHKLYFGLFSYPNTNLVKPLDDTFAYTEITWVSKGEVITLDERFIDPKAILDIDYANSLPKEGQNPVVDAIESIKNFFKNLFEDLGPIAVAIAAIVGLILISFVLVKIDQSVRNIRGFIRRNKVITIIIGALLIFLAIRLFTG